eukprot:323997-Prorocentrum_minimum.AAC.1
MMPVNGGLGDLIRTEHCVTCCRIQLKIRRREDLVKVRMKTRANDTMTMRTRGFYRSEVRYRSGGLESPIPDLRYRFFQTYNFSGSHWSAIAFPIAIAPYKEPYLTINLPPDRNRGSKFTNVTIFTFDPAAPEDQHNIEHGGYGDVVLEYSNKILIFL